MLRVGKMTVKTNQQFWCVHSQRVNLYGIYRLYTFTLKLLISLCDLRLFLFQDLKPLICSWTQSGHLAKAIQKSYSPTGSLSYNASTGRLDKQLFPFCFKASIHFLVKVSVNKSILSNKELKNVSNYLIVSLFRKYWKFIAYFSVIILKWYLVNKTLYVK